MSSLSDTKKPVFSLKDLFTKTRGHWLRPRRLLGVEIDGFSLRAAIIRAEGKKVLFESVAGSNDADPQAALAEAGKRLRQAGFELPKDAILLVPTVIPALLELPVTPARPRPYAQMQEMIRWELEPFFVQRVGAWKLGDIMVWRGYLREDQLEQIKLELERRKVEKHHHLGGLSVSALFGEVAVELGFITTEQRDECLKIQQQFQIAEDEMVCGWSPQPSAPPMSIGAGKDHAKGPDKYPWLVCGMSRGERSRWISLFKRFGLELKGIYPLVGCSAAALNGTLTPASAMIEIRAGMIGCMRLLGERVAGLQLYYTAGHTISEEAHLSWISNKTDTLYISGEESRVRPLSETLTSIRQQETRSILVEVEPSSLPEGVTTAALSGILGAARHMLRLPGRSRAVSVPAYDPGPPFWQRISVWWISAGIALILIIGLIELYLGFRMNEVRARQTEGLNVLNALEKEVSEIKDRSEAAKKLKEVLLERRKELDEAARRRAFLEKELPARASRVLSLLEDIASTLPADMIIRRIEGKEDGEIFIIGWGISEKGIQRFAEQLAKGIWPLGLRMASLDVKMEKGRLGLPGHAVEVRLVFSQPSVEIRPDSAQLSAPSGKGPDKPSVPSRKGPKEGEEDN